MKKNNWKHIIAAYCRSRGIPTRKFYYHHDRYKANKSTLPKQHKSDFKVVEVLEPQLSLEPSEFLIKLLCDGNFSIEGRGDLSILLNFLGKREAV